MSCNIPLERLNKENFLKGIQADGYVVVENVLDYDLIEQTKIQLARAIQTEAQKYGHISPKDYGMLICCPVYGGSFLKIIDNKNIMQPFDWVLGDTSIIYVYTSSSLPPNQKNYSSRIHVDRPHFIPGFVEALGCLILLDDFTEENGATWVLKGSHLLPEQPSEEFFYEKAKRIIAPKGSVFYFHLRLWHAGGHNKTDLWRHSLGIGMVRGYMKQRIDIPRAIDHLDLDGLTDYGIQKLGFSSQPPTSIDEYYLPQAQRTYRQKSEWEKL